ncbi:MAG: biotin--[acetyl-CoA-carboxylase] ligase [Pyrinomonadaceae bacterium]
MDLTILRYDSIGSTNSEAADQARRGADEGLCIIAREQTAGRGRYGRTWVSDKDAGLYLSVVLRPRLEQKYLPVITLMAGVAVHDALAELGVEPDIKWVNDVLVKEKKVCGILAEAVETERGIAVIVGIGINLTSGNFPPEIAQTATSIVTETGTLISADELAESVCRHLIHFYELTETVAGPAKIIEQWSIRSSYFSGKPVRVTLNDEVFDGVSDGLEQNGALRIRTPDGSIRIVQAGDVERLRAGSES